MSDERPNILCIMSDEHDPAVTGCYGDPIVRTPTLDRLAAEGIVFDSAYTTSPLCVPARLSFTAGKYVSRCGAWSNSRKLPSDDYPALPRLLADAGYDSVLGGKMHYDRNRRYGFRDLFDFTYGQNKHDKHGRGGRLDPDTATPNRKSWEDRSAEFHVGDDSLILGFDRDVTKHCSEYLRNRTRRDRPLFLLAGYLAPHFPLIAPQRYYDLYRDRVPMPNIPEGMLEHLPQNYKSLRTGFGMEDQDPEIVKKGRELYWALVNWMDDEIAKLLNALTVSEVGENTVIIYTSDHGENKGDHGLWWKNNMFEHSARIPLILHHPARWEGNQRRTAACSTVDLTRTIADLAGVETPEDWDGESLVPCLDDANVEMRDLAVSEYYAHNISSGFAMIRRGRFKYVYHTRINDTYGPEAELYDLVEDPGEITNLAGNESRQGLVRDLHAALVEELGRDPEEAEAECRRDYKAGYGTSG